MDLIVKSRLEIARVDMLLVVGERRAGIGDHRPIERGAAVEGIELQPDREAEQPRDCCNGQPCRPW